MGKKREPLGNLGSKKIVSRMRNEKIVTLSKAHLCMRTRLLPQPAQQTQLFRNIASPKCFPGKHSAKLLSPLLCKRRIEGLDAAFPFRNLFRVFPGRR